MSATRDRLLDIAQMLLVLPPNTQPLYSNLGFDLLGHTLAAVHNSTYENAIQKWFEPWHYQRAQHQQDH